MGRKKAKKAPRERPRRQGRLLSVWHVLIGRAQTIEQIQGEWSVIQAQAAEVFNRFNALAARLVRAERNSMKANLESMAQLEMPQTITPPTGDRRAHKADLRRRARERIIGRIPHVPSDQNREVSG